MKAKFCVIGAQINTVQGRTWTEVEDHAIIHAKELMRRNDKCDMLYVVEVKAIVRRPLPTVEVVRPDDMPDL